jgi:hypothetical protein
MLSVLPPQIGSAALAETVCAAAPESNRSHCDPFS